VVNIAGAERAAAGALAAIKARQGDKAVRYAESAVSLSPQSADLRAILGQSYLLAGRFVSAEASYRESLILKPANAKAILNLALAQIAQGKYPEARQTLDDGQALLPVTDRGLALALAGDREEAVAVLENAARAITATPQIRQNLALAYALAGRWNEARITAAQDVSPDELEARLTSWALFASPKGTADQVASLLHVSPAVDPGRPVELALAPVEPKPEVQLAQAEPITAPAPAPVAEPVAAPQPTQSPEPVVVESVKKDVVAEPVQVAQAEVPAAPVVSEPSPAPVAPAQKPMLIKPQPAPAVAAVPPLLRAEAKPVRVAAFQPSSLIVAPKRRAVGEYVVQLGAFSSAARLEAAWNRARKGAAYIGNYMPVSTLYKNSLHRLSVSGFATRAQAVATCEKLHNAGLACFVRSTAGDAPIQWASRETKLAMR
jgi:Flp pilus assembly protein TadD